MDRSSLSRSADEQAQQQNIVQDESTDEQPSSSLSSAESASAAAGGNLTAAEEASESEERIVGQSESAGGQSVDGERREAALGAEQRRASAATLSSAEYQSTLHEMGAEEEEEDDDEAPESPRLKSVVAPLEQGKLEDIAKQRAENNRAKSPANNQPAANQLTEPNVTRIQIEKGCIVSVSGQSVAPLEAAAIKVAAGTGNAIASSAGQAPRLQLSMPRSATSPALGQLAQQALASGGWSPASKRAHQPDTTSQYSLNTQRNYQNHFEIRWHNVRLFARRTSQRVPKFVSQNSTYQYLAARWAGDNEDEFYDKNSCYSPPVKHKQWPDANKGSIETGLEMRGFRGTPVKEPTSTASSASNGSNESQQHRSILNNISGQVYSGQLTAVLGPSGVGKTSLLNSLTGRNTLDGTGRVSLIGASTRKRMSVVTVPQADVLPGKLTVWEDLLFTSRLKNPQAKFDHKRNISRIVKHLHMDKFLHNRIDKLSGGEQRRLSIGRELLASPDIMILDEPTSGLDANTCKKIITALRDIVEHSDHYLDKPMSIIVTIHQPQQEVYNLFHRVYVMAVGGRCIYEGPPGLLLPTLLEQSTLSKATEAERLNDNPAIVAIEVASGEYGPQIIEQLADHHEDQIYEQFSHLGNIYIPGTESGEFGAALGSPLNTPRMLRAPRKSPMSLRGFEMVTPRHHRRRLHSFGSLGGAGRLTPVLAKRQLVAQQQQQQQQQQHLGQFQFPQYPNLSNSQMMALERASSMTSISYASTYDAELPEVNSKLKVDKRLRRSVVIKSHLLSNTWTLMQRCWLLSTRDLFLMAIRVLGFLLVAAGTVQIFAHSLDPNEHQCPFFESRVEDVRSYVDQVKDRLQGLEPMLKQANAVHMFFFHLLLCITMVTSALTGLVFPMQMRMFMREYKNGWYSPASFIISQTLAELPIDIIGPLITLLITYPLCQQPSSAYYWREIGYAIVLISCSIICKSQAQIVGAVLMDSIENSVFISCVCVVGPALLSGIPIRITSMVTPLKIASYGSFLRYGFESLLALRYGYGLCPCDPNLVHGFPLDVSAEAVPPHLENMARGFFELSRPINATTSGSDTVEGLTINTSSINDQVPGNLITHFIRSIAQVSNMMTPESDLGDCNKYRSLYLIGMEISNDILPKWLSVMALMFVISRILTYFVVRTVIKMRRN